MAATTTRGQTGDLVLKESMSGEELVSRNPTVLSCGGIYIPRNTHEEKRILYHIITTQRKDEPVRVVGNFRPRNSLHEILLRESLN